MYFFTTRISFFFSFFVLAWLFIKFQIFHLIDAWYLRQFAIFFCYNYCINRCFIFYFIFICIELIITSNIDVEIEIEEYLINIRNKQKRLGRSFSRESKDVMGPPKPWRFLGFATETCSARRRLGQGEASDSRSRPRRAEVLELALERTVRLL